MTETETYYLGKNDRAFKYIMLNPKNQKILKGVLENALHVKIKKIGTELEQEASGCKVVSLRFSAHEDKNNLSKSRKPPKVKYDIVNTLINDYRAKLFAKAHSPEAVNDINNEMKNSVKNMIVSVNEMNNLNSKSVEITAFYIAF